MVNIVRKESEFPLHLECASTVDQANNILNKNAPRKYSEVLLDYCLQARFDEDKILGKRYLTRYHIIYENINSKNIRHDFNIEEELFGIGFHDAQCKELVFLELLNILASQNLEDPFALEQTEDMPTYSLVKMHRTLLRRVLFNNPYISNINALSSITDAEKWNQWFKQFANNNKIAESSISKHNYDEDDDYYDDPDKSPNPSERNFNKSDLNHLQNNFNSFNDFEKAVKLLRSWAILSNNKRQWSYRYLFPFGVESLFWECTTKLDFKNNYMAGAGQIIFSMLARSYHNKAHETNIDNVGKILSERFFKNVDAVNLYAKLICEGSETHVCSYEQDERSQLYELNHMNPNLQPKTDKDKHSKVVKVKQRYFPYKHLDIFDRVSEDFSNVLYLPLNKQEYMLTLSTISLLTLNTFLLEQQQKILSLGGNSIKNIDIVVALDDNVNLRKLSRKRLKENTDLYQQSIEHYCKHHVKTILQSFAPFLINNPQLNKEEQLLLIKVCRTAFALDEQLQVDLTSQESKLSKGKHPLIDKAVENQSMSYQDVLSFFIGKITARDLHMNSSHISFAYDIGLTNKANSSRYYTLCDDLVRCLVITILGQRSQMQLATFLELLHSRYHIVIGPAQGQQYYKGLKANSPNYLEETRFSANLEAFKQQLRRLNLAISLSDGFDYVKNPFVNWLNNQ